MLNDVKFREIETYFTDTRLLDLISALSEERRSFIHSIRFTIPPNSNLFIPLDVSTLSEEFPKIVELLPNLTKLYTLIPDFSLDGFWDLINMISNF